MNILIYGAGVIGQIYGGRLAEGGHNVTLLARGDRVRSLAEHGVTLCKDGELRQWRPQVVTAVPADTVFDVVLVAVRRDQVAHAAPQLAHVAADHVVFLLNQGIDLEELRRRTGPERTLFGFPGVGGYQSSETAVTYIEIPQQKTTIEHRAGRERPVVEMLRTAGFPVAVSDSMGAWLATHSVFVTAVGAAVLAEGGDSVALAADRRRVADVVAAVGEGFRALSRQGIPVTPVPLRLIFTVVPRFFAVRYWQRQLRGPVGTVAIAPHMRATGYTELPVLGADVRRLVAGHGPTPHLDQLLEPLRDRAS
ncbi:MAG TPA: 2-dehydropantoate 2-reductase N-terminal domain-containing protein [Micromonosporaceae bacterium]|nr:2-dehydropantoate 2-reductase N-terminal domain-containing protein [Micromonosporaceae bacterium]